MHAKTAERRNLGKTVMDRVNRLGNMPEKPAVTATGLLASSPLGEKDVPKTGT